MKKKWIASGVAACFAAASLGTPIAVGLAADRITLSDLVQAAKLMVNGTELTPEQLEKYDLTGDGRLTLSDIVQMAKQFTEEMTPEPTAAPAVMITPESAQAIALGDVEGASSSAQALKCELDSDDGLHVYEVEFQYSGARYEYEIEAFNGNILKSSWERRPSEGFEGAPMALDEAVAFVLGRVPGASQTNVIAELETEDGVPVYDIEVKYGELEYEAVIVRSTGELIKWSKKAVFSPGGSTPPAPAPTPASSQSPASPDATVTPATMISENEAKRIAAELVPGASAEDIRQCKLDRENGVQVYEIELYQVPREYSFHIRAVNGAVLKQSWEQPPTAGYTGSPMDRDGAAQDLASRVSGAPVSSVRTSYDTSHGTEVVEAELDWDGFEYDATYVRATGELIEWSAEAANYTSIGPSQVPGQETAIPTPPAAEPSPSRAPEATASPTPIVAEPSPSIPPSPTVAPVVTSIPDKLIGSEAAKNIALSRVPGADASNVVKIDLDHDHGRQVYEIEIMYNMAEYEIKVDAISGEVIEFEIDH